MASLDTRPGSLDVFVRPGNAHALKLTWPSLLTGRTFTANLAGTALPVSVSGSTVTVTFPAATTATLTGRVSWQLVETTAAAQVLVTGHVLASDSGTSSQTSSVNVSVEESSVVVTVLGEPGPASPATTVTSETTFGLAPVVGVGTQQAREDHSHGSPTNPVPAHEAAADPHAGYRLESVALTDADVAAANKDGLAAVPSLRTLGTTATSAAAGNDPRLSDTRTPTAGSVTDASVAAGAAIAESKLALASDAAAATPSRRTLGTTATSAAAGNDARLSDQRTPLDLSVTDAKVAAANKDGLAGVPSMRTLGTTATSAAAGNDSRFPAGADIVDADIGAAAAIAESKLNLASDAAAGTASRRTLGTTATSAAAGNDSRLSDARTPTAHAATHAAAGTDPVTLTIAQTTGLQTALDSKVPAALVDLKGDLIVASAPDVVARLPVGANGQVLTADSVEPLGVKWAPGGSGGGVNTVATSTAYNIPVGLDAPNSGQAGAPVNTAYWYLVFLPANWRLDTLAVYVSTAGAGASVRLAIYNVSANLTPTTLLADYGTVPGTTTGLKAVTGTVTGSAGWYALAVWQNSDSSVRYLRSRPSQDSGTLFGWQEGAPGSSRFGFSIGAVDYGAGFPASAPAINPQHHSADTNSTFVVYQWSRV